MAETLRSNGARRSNAYFSRRRIENKPQSLRAGSRGALFAQRLRALGPYALLEIVLPGGTLLAISLYAYRRWTGAATDLSAAQPVIETCVAALFIAMVAFAGSALRNLP